MNTKEVILVWIICLLYNAHSIRGRKCFIIFSLSINIKQVLCIFVYCDQQNYSEKTLINGLLKTRTQKGQLDLIYIRSETDNIGVKLALL